MILNTYAKTYLLKQFSIDFLIKMKLRLVLDTFSVFINKSRW